MRTRVLRVFLLGIVLNALARVAGAQEATSGVEVRATVTAQTLSSNVLTEEPRSGSLVTGGYRAVVYPTIKFNEHFVITAALQSLSRPYGYDDLSSAGYGIRDTVLQASLGYARVSTKGSLLVRVGELSTAFGSFPLRYDDADNPLSDAPLQYGYYDNLVSTLGVAGAQVDVTRGKWDGRAQLANSSPANPRSVFARDQYANWVGGGGYTIRQGFRVGVSAFRGPYLSRDYDGFSPNEAPSSLAARAAGVDVQWDRGHWNLQGEWQTFVFPSKAIPSSREQAGYVEARRVLTPRWYVAGRSGYTHSRLNGTTENFEVVGALRPNRFQTIKFAYELYRESGDEIDYDHKVTVQLVSSVRLFSRGRE